MPSAFHPIAITGLSALFPQARNLDEFWRLILSGRDCMQEVPPTHWLIEDYYDAAPRTPLKTYARKGAFLKEVPFDPMAYGLPPSSLPATDIAQVLALMLARAVLEDASDGQIARLQLERTSIILGVASATELISSMSGLLTRPMWIEGMRRAGVPEPQVQEAVKQITALFPDWTENTFPGCLGNVVAGRVANRFNLGGTNCVTDAACASSLAALHAGIGELQLGTSDRVISGGVDALNSIFMFMCFSQTPAMSASGKCSPFAQAADGTMMGEGGGMLCLRRLEDAERAGEPIYAVIRGLGASSDGRAKSVYAPRPEGQALALQRCYEAAGYSPATVGLVEAHGTATAAGDACEVAALKEVFSAADDSRRHCCALGSVKSQIGHTKGAAGAAGLIKAALALRHRVLPPTANVDAPNPALGLDDSPFYLSAKARPWIVAEGEPRRAGVSSFGFGGTNFHVTLEEYRGATAAPRVRAVGVEVFLASGDRVADVLTALQGWAGVTEAGFALAAREAQGRFSAAAPVRVAVVAATPAELAAKTQRLVAAWQSGPRDIAGTEGVFASTMAPTSGGIAYLFPGQGSQSVGMAAELPMSFPAAMHAWEKFEAAAPDGTPRLAGVVYPPPVWSDAEREAQEQRLRRTEHAQPALGAVALGYLAVLEAAGLKPQFTGGHSFGEVVALYAAGVIGWEDCVRTSRRRGELMAEAAAGAPGAMTAVLHPATEVSALAAEFPGCVVANHNSPQQVVIAGPVDAVTAFEAGLTARQITFRRLPVGTAFHSPLVAAACAPFERFLEGVAFFPALVPVFHNRTAAPYPADAAAARRALARQLAEPVRFVDQLRAMHAAGARVFVEVGPGTVLTGLVRQTLGEEAVAVALQPSGQPADVGLLHALARLAVLGVPINWEFLWDGHRAPRALEKTSAATLSVGAYNLGRAYPPRDGQKTPPVLVPAIPAAIAPPASMPATPFVAPPPVGRLPERPVPTSHASARSPALSSVKPVSASSHDAIARAHETFLRTMAEAHRSFLASMTGAPMGVASEAPVVASAPSAPAAAPMPAPVLQRPAPVALPQHKVAPTLPAAPAPSARPHDTDPDNATGASRPQERTKNATAEVIEVVMKTVAEKTGYPRDMLQPAMQLEGDLGIDSIKRVEILSAVQKQLPGLPSVDAKVMGTLQTLQAISDYLVERMGAAEPNAMGASRPQNTPIATGGLQTTPTRSADEVIEVVMKTVAEKTGYPRDMLKPEMLLEGDLGIDSIKRVEILSAVQKQLPGLPAVDAKVMGTLQTLQAISDYLIERLESAGSNATGASRPQMATTAPVTSAAEQSAATAKLVQIAVKALEHPDALPLSRLEVHAAPAPASGLAAPFLHTARRLVVTDDGTGVAAALVSALATHEIKAERVKTVPADADAVILLEGLQPSADADMPVRAAFEQLRRLAPRFTDAGGLLVIVQATGGALGLAGKVVSPTAGGLAGLAKTAAKEWPRATVRLIDLEPGAAQALADAVAHELLRGGSELEIGVRADGERTRPVLIAADERAPGVSRVSACSVVLATGGGRGVTAATLIALARAHRPAFALVGRTELKTEDDALTSATSEAELRQALLTLEQSAGRRPTPKQLAALVGEIVARREIRATLAALREAGSRAEYFSCDTTDAKAVAAVVERTRASLGRVTTLIHGAGVLADRLIADKTREQFARVFDTKVAGLRALLAAVADEPLDALVLFSSVAGRFGNRGQADYAAANEVLNKMAHAEFERRGGRCLVRSINWGPWEGGMVTPELREHFRLQGVGVIPREAGAALLVRELAGAATRTAIEVVVGVGRLDVGAGSSGAAVRRGELRVDAQRFPALESHVVKGRPVVPIALAAEWLLGAAQLARGDRAPSGLRDLQVLKPIVLDDGASVTLELTTREVVGNRVELLLSDAVSQQKHYQAIADWSGKPATALPAKAAAEWQPFSYDVTGVYDGRMFHGRDFQVVTALVGWSTSGAELQIENRPGIAGDWRIGPAALDGALQAATLWVLERTGQSSLPMRIAELSVRRALQPGERCSCRVHGTTRELGSSTDVDCVSADGSVVFSLRGLECFPVDSYWPAVKA